MDGKTILERNWIILFGFFLLFLLWRPDMCGSQELKSFGESCDMDCDERQLLVCSKNTSVCECMQPNTMHFDPEQLKCVGKAGGAPCVRYPPSEYLCITHASCNKTSRLCNCNKGYFETENGTTCSLMSKYGDPCNAKKPCDRRSGMACLPSTKGKRICQCMFPKDQYFDHVQNTCVSYSGGNCSFSLPCVRNALCSIDIYELRQGENMHGKAYLYNVTIGRKCGCLEGTSRTSSRQCLPTYGELCDHGTKEETSCNSEEGLKCHDASTCLCSKPLTQIYDLGRRKCVSFVGARCEHLGLGEEGCVSNAVCHGGKCLCGDGFSSTPSSTCLKDFGKECGGSKECNIYRGLHCSGDKKCRCIDEHSMEYDTSSKRCLAKDGMGCGMHPLQSKPQKPKTNSSSPYKKGSLNGNAPSSNGNGNGSFQNHPPTHQQHQSHDNDILGENERIYVGCKEGLECVNEFTGRRLEEGDDNLNMLRGFCRRRQ